MQASVAGAGPRDVSAMGANLTQASIQTEHSTIFLMSRSALLR